MAFTPIIVTGTYLLPGGLPASGSITFQPTSEMRDPLTNTIISSQQVKVGLNEYGSFSVSLYATNDDGIVPEGVTYEVNERLNETGWNKYFISIDKESPGAFFDLADVIPNEQPVTTFNYTTKEYVDSQLGNTADEIPFIPTAEITSITVQDAIEEVRAKSKYVHVQNSPQTTWSVTHNLKFYPNVSIVDSALSHVMGEVTYIDENHLTVSFTSAFSGKAFLS
jgi:hypothetical protein